ncbi:MAG: sigma-70 family RNA polymerase sigma factor [Agriterribacter sp.]
MKNITCQQLLNIETISDAFKNNKIPLSEKIISCFYSCYQSLFIKWAKIMYGHYSPDVIAFAANDSFTDGVLKLQEAASRGKLYQSNASVKTVLFHYCRYKLLAQLKDEERLAGKNKKLAFFLSGQTMYSTGTENEMQEKRHELIMRALEKMTAEDRQIIQWRHIEEKTPDEIAALLAIKVPSATNRIYRCMERLRKLVEEMDER